MAKSKSRKLKRPDRLAAAIRAQDLDRGLRLAAGWKLRLVRAAEIDRARELLALADVPLDDDLAETITAGAGAAVLKAGLREGRQAMMMPIADAASRNDPNLAVVKMVALMAAVDNTGRIGAVIKVFPPGNVFSQAVAQGVAPAHALVSLTVVAKIQGLAVDPEHRGSGLGKRMLTETWRLFSQMGFMLVYGQFPVVSGMEAYYKTTEYEVLPEAAAIDLAPTLDMPLLIVPDPGERIFARWAIPGLRAFRHHRPGAAEAMTGRD